MSFDIFPLTKKLYDRLTQQRADWMDNLQYITSTVMARLDAPVSLTAQETTTAKSGVCTEERLSRLDVEVRGIRTVGHYSGFLNFDTALVDVPITAVADMAKTYVQFSYHQTLYVADSNPGSALSVRLLDTTTVRLEHGTGAYNPNAKQVYFDVIEFY